MTKMQAFTLVFAAVLLAPCARAVDGTVLINQSTSVNGLPGCPHSGFPIQICQRGSYRLSGNLTVPGTADGIDISAANVTLDLNGFMIAGPISCEGFPVVQENCSPSAAGFGAYGVNDLGQIMGLETDANGVNHIFVATPEAAAPEPSLAGVVLLFGVGFAILKFFDSSQQRR